MGDNEEYNYERVLNIIQTGDKFQKKQVLKEFRTFIQEASVENLKYVFGKLLTGLSIIFQDKAEICRENALNVCIEAVIKLEPDINFLSTLIPVIHNRLCADVVYESSEELRLLYVDLTCLLIEKHKTMVSPFVEELVDVLSKAVLDASPQVKKRGCYGINQLALLNIYEFQAHSKKLVAPLSEALKHQHWRVRVAVIEAFEIAILKGDPKILPDALTPLTNRFFDDTSHVRMALTKLIGNWMLNHYDRYSFFSQMLPLILTSLTDNDEKIRDEGHRLWDKVGSQYMMENEKDLKDKIDWVSESLEHYPAGVTRPNLGCRTLIEREVGKFALAIGRELCDWVVSVRIKSAQLLSQVVLHAEHSITQDLHKIIVPMSKAAMDEEEPSVIHYVLLAAEYLGYFVPPKSYCNVIIDYIHDSNYGELRVVAGLVKGTRGKDLKPYLNKLAHLLDNTSFKGEEQMARLDLISSIFSTCGTDSLEIGEATWAALISNAGLAASESIANRASELLTKFCDLDGGDRRISSNKFCKPLLASLLKDHWVAHCREQFIFTAVICYAGEVIEENVDTILEVFRKCLYKENTDPEVILKVLIALNMLITEEKVTLPTPEVREMFKNTVLNEVLYEQLKWKAGRSAEATRTMATTSLFLLLPRNIPDKILPIMISLVEDASVKTRQLALACLAKCASISQVHVPETFSNLVNAVLKRLDDCDQKVCAMCVECIVAVYKEEMKLENKEYFSETLLEFVFTTLLIHLDDQDQKIQKVVFDGLKTLGAINLSLLQKKIRIDRFRDKEIARQLNSFVEEQLQSDNVNLK